MSIQTKHDHYFVETLRIFQSGLISDRPGKNRDLRTLDPEEHVCKYVCKLVCTQVLI